MKYIAQTEKAIQISMDDYKLTRPALEVDESTTIGQIREWYHKVHGRTNIQFDVTIMEIDTKPQPL